MGAFWHFDKIPPEDIPEILDLYEKGLNKEIAIKFVYWGVIPGSCSGCGIPKQVPGFIDYALSKNLIPVNNERNKKTYPGAPRAKRDGKAKNQRL